MIHRYRRMTLKQRLQRMGEHAHLYGKTVQWEENHAYLDPESAWVQRTGKIKNAGVKDGSLGFFVENSDDFVLHWVDGAWDAYRNIQVL